MQVLGPGWDKAGANALDVGSELPEELLACELLFLGRLIHWDGVDRLCWAGGLRGWRLPPQHFPR
jgi:hypothetical protein